MARGCWTKHFSQNQAPRRKVRLHSAATGVTVGGKTHTEEGPTFGKFKNTQEWEEDSLGGAGLGLMQC